MTEHKESTGLPTNTGIPWLLKLANGRYRFGPVASTAPTGPRDFMKQTKHRTKAEVWFMCVEAGLKVGIPAHGWKRHHTSKGWSYYSLHKDVIASFDRAIARKRKETEERKQKWRRHKESE